MLARSGIRHLTRLFVGALAAVWTLDVQVNLGLLPGAFVSGRLFARARDFLALLVVSSQVALALAVAALAAGAVVAFVARRGGFARAGDAARESIAILAAALSALQVLAQSRIVWGHGAAQMPRAIVFAAVTAAVVWIAARLALRDDSARSLAGIARLTVLAPLVVGYANLTLAAALKGWGWFVAGYAALALAWLAALGARRPVVAAAPLLTAAAVAAWACLTSAAGAPALAAPPRAAAGPPILLVVLDTVRADHLELYGYPRQTMPALTAWSREAFVAERAVSPAGWTSPAHASILTGLPVSLHGVHFGERSFVTEPLDGVRWLPQELGAAGYRSLALIANPLALPAAGVGFDATWLPDRTAWHASTITALVDHRSPLLRRVSEALRWRMPYVAASEIVDETLRSLPADDGPLFALVNLTDAHSPYNPPSRALHDLGLRPGRSFARYRSHRELTTLWPRLPAGKAGDLNDLYDGELRGVDAALARLLRGIDERYGGRAWVIVTSDHGEELGEDGRVGHEQGLGQRLLHVPLVIRGPGIAAGPSNEIVDLRRLHAFVGALAAGSGPDLAPLFAGDAFGTLAERYPSGHAGGPLRPTVSLIDGEIKVVGPSPYESAAYDLAAGFDAERALDPAAPEIRRLRARIDDYWERHRDRRAEIAGLGDDERERLRSLGYVN